MVACCASIAAPPPIRFKSASTKRLKATFRTSPNSQHSWRRGTTPKRSIEKAVYRWSKAGERFDGALVIVEAIEQMTRARAQIENITS